MQDEGSPVSGSVGSSRERVGAYESDGGPELPPLSCVSSAAHAIRTPAISARGAFKGSSVWSARLLRADRRYYSGTTGLAADTDLLGRSARQLQQPLYSGLWQIGERNVETSKLAVAARLSLER